MKFLEALFLLILAGLTAFSFNYLHWRLQEKNKCILSTASTVLDYLVQIEEQSISYWSMSCFSTEPIIHHLTSKKILEIRIKSLLKISRKVILQLTSNELKSISISEKLFLNNFSSEIFDLVTGDTFEDEDIEPDLIKCAKISNKVNNAKALALKIINSNR
jgi:hypothetical protein